MNACTTRNHGLAFILVLILCQVLDYVTSQTLSFVDLVRPAQVMQVIRLEDIFAVVVSIALIVCLILYFVASQKVVYRAILITTILSLAVLILNAVGLVRTLIDRRVDPVYMLIDAVIVWVTTILIFAVCYWVLDHASQQARCANRDYTPVFVFPQNQTKYPGYEDWTPGFTDYLFFAFNTASEFGPTDTLILARRAKYLVMAEVTLSLLVILVLAARAIGLIH